MSFKSKQNSFAKNINDENKANEIKESQQNKNIRNSSILPKTNSDTTNSATAQKWRNTVRGVVKINKVVNKNANYAAPELENLNTLEKIIKLQEDLKIVASIKQQFEGNQKKLIEKMNKFCLNYYKNKINMKKIFDYCSDNDAEKNYEYNLLTTEQAKEVLKDIYDDVFDFIFLIRNDNRLMLKIIDNCESEGYEDISDFLALI